MILSVAERLERIQAKMNRKGFKDRLGQCYANAGRFILDRPSDRIWLVHGSIQLVGDPIDHAWVEFEISGPRTAPKRMVYEPTTDSEWKANDFYEVFGAMERVRYTRDQACAIMLSVCHFGPWDASAQEGATGSETRAVSIAKSTLR